MALEGRLGTAKISRFAEENLQIAIEKTKRRKDCAAQGHGEIRWLEYLVSNPRRPGKKRPGTCLECGGRVYGSPNLGKPPGWAEKKYYLDRTPLTR